MGSYFSVRTVKLIKLTFWGTLIFFGLYFFGDFRINEVNVRDYLQTQVTPEKLAQIKNQATHLYETLKGLFEASKKDESGKTKMMNPLDGKPMETISPDDQEKLLKLLQKNLDDLQPNQNKK
jgi:hypothetical protein